MLSEMAGHVTTNRIVGVEGRIGAGLSNVILDKIDQVAFKPASVLSCCCQRVERNKNQERLLIGEDPDFSAILPTTRIHRDPKIAHTGAQ